MTPTTTGLRCVGEGWVAKRMAPRICACYGIDLEPWPSTTNRMCGRAHMYMLRHRFGATAEDHSDHPGDWMRQLRLGGEKDVCPPVNEHDAVSIRGHGRR